MNLSTPPRIRLLLIDDHNLFRRGLKALLEQDGRFEVSAEGKAMTDAALGAVVQVKMEGGKLLSGIVRPNGIVERSP